MDEQQIAHFGRMIRQAAEEAEHAESQEASQQGPRTKAVNEEDGADEGHVDPAGLVEGQGQERAGGAEADPQAAAGGRDLLAAARRIRVHLTDRQFIDLAVTIEWPEWVDRLNRFQGIMFDHGFIPLQRILLIGPLTEQGEPDEQKPLPDNVVPIRRPT